MLVAATGIDRKREIGREEMKALAVSIFAAANLFASMQGANAAPILNGSFETPTVPVGGFTDFPVGSSALTNWSVVGPAGTNVSIVSGSFSQNGVSFPA
jgi:hypothetical protein